MSVLRAAWIGAMVATPLFGFWLASSLAAYRNASQWLALLAGLLLFPIVPAGWELFARWRRSKQPATRPILTGLDRLVLRTLVINGVFLAAMLWRAPETAFRALAVRGDLRSPFALHPRPTRQTPCWIVSVDPVAKLMRNASRRGRTSGSSRGARRAPPSPA